MKHLFFIITSSLLILPCALSPAMAQTNMTSRLKNANFESGFTGWTQNGMQTQGNTAFARKSGNTYVERWTERGNAVGSCSVAQTVTGIKVGTYRLTVAAQNIQEDTPTAAQTGACIFADTAQTAVTVTADYTVQTVVIDGTLTVGFEAVNASGNWLAVDNFRLTWLDDAHDAVRDALQQAVAAARALYADGTGTGADDFDAVIKQAEATLNDDASTSEAMAEQKQKVEEAETAFRLANASGENPVDMTDRLVNPSFEEGFAGWTQVGMQTQGNTAFTLKSGNTYVERWTQRGNAVGDGSVLQTVKGLTCGRYRLTASAQNIQEGSPTIHRSGAWLVGDDTRTAVGTTAEYDVTFVVVTGDATVGFVAEGAKGNWIACDDFHLEYLGADADGQQAEMQRRIEAAETLTSKKMNAATLERLQGAIADARNATPGLYTEVAVALRDAVAQAEASSQAYGDLLAAIEAAGKVAATGGGNGREAFEAAIGQAQALYDRDDSRNDAMQAQVEALGKATFAYRIANASGVQPRVTTDPRYVRGAIAAFGRMKVTGIAESQLLEKGFCWSTEPDPTVLDNRTTEGLENNGVIYRMDMKPATVYYFRAYAMTKNYAVGYGDVIKMSTLPMGNVTYTYYNNDGGDFHNNKNTNALSEACWYWSNYTSIQGFHVTANYSAGTPTADCGYGGGMRIGPNTGQRTGTMMHEMNHGIGGGTIPVWGGFNESPLRTSVNGDWAGEHTNAVLRFWENREDLVVTAAYDGAHWGIRTLNGTYSHDNNWCDKYSFNGSHLEAGNWAGPSDWNGTQIVYIGNSLLNQAMCEDGLVPVNYWGGGFCLPAYDFVQDDLTKYYIKSESPEHGLYDAFLTEAKAGKLQWTSVSDGSVTENDSAAWYVTFDPATQYYVLRNAATNHVLTYSYGFKAVARTTPGINDKFHFMRGRNDVSVGKAKARGYWVIHPENSNTPATMTAAAGGSVSATPLDLYDAATQQRWLFIAADEVEAFETGSLQAAKDELMAYIRQLRKLKETPHHEDTEGTDELFEDCLLNVEATASTATSTKELKALTNDARTAAIDFLSNATPSDPTNPFDLTFMVHNAAINSNEGWSDPATFSESCCEYFQRTFDFNQTVTGLPQGNFKLTAQAFQRPGHYEAAYSAFANGNNEVSALLYAAAQTQKVQHIAEGASERRIHADDVSVATGVFIPNTMASAAAHFKRGSYENEVWAATTRKNASLKIGIRGSVTKDGYWTIFDNFHLYFFGTLTKETATAINAPAATVTATPPAGVFTLSGTRLRPNNDLSGLPAGLYIVAGKKVVVR